MGHLVQETSIMQYQAIKPVLGELQRDALWAFSLLTMENGDATDSEAAAILGHRENRNHVSPRRFELEEYGYLIFTQKRRCKVTGRTVMAWRAKGV